MLAVILLVLLVVAASQSTPLRAPDEVPQDVGMQKRLSNDALIRLLMRNSANQFLGVKRGGEKRAELERRSFDDDFSNCFLSPVQCMLPTSRK